MANEKLNQTEARQAERGRPALWVLIVSVALMAIALVGLMTWQGSESPKDYASQSQDASRKEVTGSVGGGGSSTSSANSGGVPAGNPSYPQPATPGANSAGQPK